MTVAGWNLPSNRADRVAAWEMQQRIDDESDAGAVLICRFTFKALSYAWEQPSGTEPETASDYVLTLSGLRIRVPVLAGFESDLRRWLDLPVDQLARTPLSASAELGGRYDEFLRLEFGPRATPSRMVIQWPLFPIVTLSSKASSAS